LHNVEIAVDDFGGLAEVRNKILRERRESKPLGLRLKLAPLPAGRFRMGNRNLEIPSATYELNLDVRNETGLPEIVSEHLSAEVRSGTRSPTQYRLSRSAEEAARYELRRPVPERYLHLYVAVRRLECGYLGDPQAIAAAIPGAQWQPPADTAACHRKNEIRRLLQRPNRSAVAYNEIEFAKATSPKFSPARARTRSASFEHCWKRMEAAWQRRS
jgi:hypothetical protein